MSDTPIPEQMRELTKAEIDNFNAKMRQWQTPAQVESLMIDVSNTTQFYKVSQGRLSSIEASAKSLWSPLIRHPWAVHLRARTSFYSFRNLAQNQEDHLTKYREKG